MRKRLSKLGVVAAASLSAVALAAPGSASANPPPCHHKDTLLPVSVQAWYAPADANGNGYICLGPDKSGAMVDLTDDRAR
jgi:hypothetical protein